MSKIIHMRRLYIGILGAFSMLCVPLSAFCQQVAVETLKTTYFLDQKITVKITNGLAGSVFTVAASDRPEMGLSNLEKKASVGWDALPLRCRQPSCKVDYTMPQPQEIKAGGGFTFSWQPRIFVDNKYVRPEPGTYRVTILYQRSKEGDPRALLWTTVRSNTFNLE
jgi:hypothetical protein